MRPAIYLRVSTDDRGQTVENQRLPLLEYCQAQGWNDPTEYADEASATDLRGRKAWRRLLDDAARRKLDLVLVWRLDRMARSVLDAAQTLERLRAWGVGLRSYSEPYLDTTSPFGEALFYITMAYAQLERGILSERTKAGMERARRQGKRIGRPPVMAMPGFAQDGPKSAGSWRQADCRGRRRAGGWASAMQHCFGYSMPNPRWVRPRDYPARHRRDHHRVVDPTGAALVAVTSTPADALRKGGRARVLVSRVVYRYLPAPQGLDYGAGWSQQLRTVSLSLRRCAK